jgi:predicted nucleotidyltransferase
LLNADQAVAELTLQIRAAVGEKLVGLYLHGSMTCGDFDAGCSDLDLLAVLRSDLHQDEFQRLRRMHEGFI